MKNTIAKVALKWAINVILLIIFMFNFIGYSFHLIESYIPNNEDVKIMYAVIGAVILASLLAIASLFVVRLRTKIIAYIYIGLHILVFIVFAYIFFSGSASYWK